MSDRYIASAGELDVNTVLLILNLILTAGTTTMLGMRCKMRKTSNGFMASCRPKNSSPSPEKESPVAVEKSRAKQQPRELEQVVVVKDSIV